MWFNTRYPIPWHQEGFCNQTLEAWDNNVKVWLISEAGRRMEDERAFLDFHLLEQTFKRIHQIPVFFKFNKFLFYFSVYSMRPPPTLLHFPIENFLNHAFQHSSLWRFSTGIILSTCRNCNFWFSMILKNATGNSCFYFLNISFYRCPIWEFIVKFHFAFILHAKNVLTYCFISCSQRVSAWQ